MFRVTHMIRKDETHLPLYLLTLLNTEFFVKKGVSIINGKQKNGNSQFLWLAYAVSLLYAVDKKS